MPMMSATHARKHFGDLLSLAAKVPVRLQKNGRDVAMVVSIEDYQWLVDHAPTKGVNPRILELLPRVIEEHDDLFRALAQGPKSDAARS